MLRRTACLINHCTCRFGLVCPTRQDLYQAIKSWLAFHGFVLIVIPSCLVLYGRVLYYTYYFWTKQKPVTSYVLFSNDGPLGSANSEVCKIPYIYGSVWNNLNSIGTRDQPPPNGAITSGLRTLCWYKGILPVWNLYEFLLALRSTLGFFFMTTLYWLFYEESKRPPTPEQLKQDAETDARVKAFWDRYNKTGQT